MSTYKDVGVDVAKADSVLKKLRKKADIFTGRFHNDMVASCDGVGTKILLAKKSEHYKALGIDLVAMNVNDLVVMGAKPLVFMDYISIGKLDEEIFEGVLDGILEGCEQAGCQLIGGELAEMPGMYSDGHFDLAGFSVGKLIRPDFKLEDFCSGDKIIALPSNGIHSNGFSLVRKAITGSPITEDLLDNIMAPTRIYVKEVLNLIKTTPSVDIKSLVHITGGGLYKRVKDCLPKGFAAIINKESVPTQEVFSYIRKEGGVQEFNMFSTFNMGVGFAAVVSPQAVFSIQSMNQEWKVIGEVIKADSPQGRAVIIL